MTLLTVLKLRMAFLSKSSAHILIIAVVGLIAYSNTFKVPFLYDDLSFIIENPAVKGPRFRMPSKAGYLNIEDHDFRVLRARPVVFASFWLNNELWGKDVRGYHAYNLAVHILNGLLVYTVVLLILRTPAMVSFQRQRHVSLFTALLFVAHPVQTQAVTYISQRFTSMAALFYLGSVVMYMKWRLTPHLTLPPGDGVNGREGKGKGIRRGVIFYLLSLLLALLAMKSKENAFTLPLALALCEFMFFGGPVRKRLLYLAPLSLTMLIIPLTELSGAGGIAQATRTATELPREQYFFTQFRAMVTYIRLLLLPVNQNLDYDYPVYGSFWEPVVLLSFLSLALIFLFAAYIIRPRPFFEALASGSAAGLRMISFGIFWFFLTMSVESGLIPIADLFLEHRLYLPSVGALLALVTGAAMLGERRKGKKMRLISAAAAALIIPALTYAAFARNEVWRGGLTLWTDVVEKSPGKMRGYNNLANIYANAGETDRALELYRKAVELEPKDAQLHYNFGTVSLWSGLPDDAIEHLLISLRLNPRDPKAHLNLARAYRLKGLTDDEIRHYLIAIKLRPDYKMAHLYLGRAYFSKGLPDKALEHFEVVAGYKASSETEGLEP